MYAGGAGRDEEKARAKKEFFVRDEFGQWDPKDKARTGISITVKFRRENVHCIPRSATGLN
jgi:hypothetical protein